MEDDYFVILKAENWKIFLNNKISCPVYFVQINQRPLLRQELVEKLSIETKIKVNYKDKFCNQSPQLNNVNFECHTTL